MRDRQQKHPAQLAFEREAEVKPKADAGVRAESLTVGGDTESKAGNERMMEEILERENLAKALGRVESNKGSAGVDGMRVEELREYLKHHWPALRPQLLEGTYRPAPVKRVEIPKASGGVRKLGIPAHAECLRVGSQLLATKTRN